MSKRGHDINTIPFYENMMFYAPLTEDGKDIVKDKIPTVNMGTASYDENGVYLSGGYLNYTMSFAEMLEAKTFHCVVTAETLPNQNNYIYIFGSTYNNNFRDGVFITNSKYFGKTLSYSSNRYDKDITCSKKAESGQTYRITTVFEPSAQKFYVDDVLVWENIANDNFHGFGSGNGLLNIGNQFGYPTRYLNGHVKDFKILNIPLSSSEIELL